MTVPYLEEWRLTGTGRDLPVDMRARLHRLSDQT